jgi:hypothetical protein
MNTHRVVKLIIVFSLAIFLSALVVVFPYIAQRPLIEFAIPMGQTSQNAAYGAPSDSQVLAPTMAFVMMLSDVYR